MFSIDQELSKYGLTAEDYECLLEECSKKRIKNLYMTGKTLPGCMVSTGQETA